MSSGSYAGDLDAGEVWSRLEADQSAQLIDVRTRAEWSFVGIPDLEGIGKSVILIEWQSYPATNVNSAFVRELQSEVDRRGLSKDAPLFFLCRSGARSQAAAMAAAANGFSQAYNVTGGFEGPVGPDGHRGGVLGWKADGLPWTQS
jgi:rhodanese-related sulfurtransferase